jgi:hypothetical protein
LAIERDGRLSILCSGLTIPSPSICHRLVHWSQIEVGTPVPTPENPAWPAPSPISTRDTGGTFGDMGNTLLTACEVNGGQDLRSGGVGLASA